MVAAGAGKNAVGAYAIDETRPGRVLMASGPCLARLSLTFLDRLPGRLFQPGLVASGRYRYRSGFVARRSAEGLPPLRRLEAMVRGSALASSA